MLWLWPVGVAERLRRTGSRRPMLRSPSLGRPRVRACGAGGEAWESTVLVIVVVEQKPHTSRSSSCLVPPFSPAPRREPALVRGPWRASPPSPPRGNPRRCLAHTWRTSRREMTGTPGYARELARAHLARVYALFVPIATRLFPPWTASPNASPANDMSRGLKGPSRPNMRSSRRPGKNHLPSAPRSPPRALHPLRNSHDD